MPKLPGEPMEGPPEEMESPEGENKLADLQSLIDNLSERLADIDEKDQEAEAKKIVTPAFVEYLSEKFGVSVSLGPSDKKMNLEVQFSRLSHHLHEAIFTQAYQGKIDAKGLAQRILDIKEIRSQLHNCAETGSNGFVLHWMRHFAAMIDLTTIPKALSETLSEPSSLPPQWEEEIYGKRNIKPEGLSELSEVCRKYKRSEKGRDYDLAGALQEVGLLGE